MRLLLIAAYLCCACALAAQSAFYHRYDWTQVADYPDCLLKIDGGYLVALGRFDSNTDLPHLGLARLTDSGDTVWTYTLRRYPFTDSKGFTPFKMALFQDSSILVVGSSGRYQEPANDDAFAARFSKDGQLLWYRYYGSPLKDIAMSVVVLADNTALIAGGWGWDGGDGIPEKHFWKINADGDLLWEKNIATTSPIAPELIQMQTLPNGNLVVTYSNAIYILNGYPIVVGMDSLCQLQWEKTIPYSCTLQDVQVGPTGSIYLDGSEGEFYEHNIYKYSPAGDFIWKYTLPGGLAWPPSRLAVTSSETLYYVTTRPLVAAIPDAYYAVMVHKFSSNGDSLWTHLFYQTGVDSQFTYSHAVCALANGGLAIAGNVSNGGGPFGPDPWYLMQLDSNGCLFGNCDATTQIVLGYNDIQPQVRATVFPNPACDRVTVSLEHESAILKIRLFDPAGRLIQEQDHENTGMEMLDLSALTSGLYSIVIQTQNASGAFKLMHIGSVK